MHDVQLYSELLAYIAEVLKLLYKTALIEGFTFMLLKMK